MKGVILAGGLGTRLRPLTDHRNKHLVPVAGRPMLWYPLSLLAEAGINDITIVTGVEHVCSIAEVAESWRCAWALSSPGAIAGSVRVVPQARPGGIADALLATREAVGDGPVCVALGDNLFGSSVRDAIASFERTPSWCHLMLAEVQDADGFGVASLSGDRLVAIAEKPDGRGGPAMIAAGLYLYGPGVFERAAALTPSMRGELEITDLNNGYIADGLAVWSSVRGWWADAGTHKGLSRAESLVRTRGAAGVNDLPT